LSQWSFNIETCLEIEVEETGWIEPPTVIEAVDTKIPRHPLGMANRNGVPSHVQGDHNQKLHAGNGHEEMMYGLPAKEIPAEALGLHRNGELTVIPIDVLFVQSNQSHPPPPESPDQELPES
jgi:hypothetical protein